MTTSPTGRTWVRGAIGRALIALIMVGALVTSGWLLTRDQEPAPVAQSAPVPDVPTAGGGSVPAGPSVLEASAPVQAEAPDEGRKALDAWAAGMSGPLDIPARALAGYATGELVLRTERPGCHLSWVTLAGLGKAGSDHGRFGGGQLAEDGKAVKPLGAVPLQGAAGEAAAEQRSGPMQLSAAEWKRGGDAIPGSAEPNIQDIDDASVAAGRVLCATGDLTAGNGWWKAIQTYRDSDLFRQQVLGNAQLYAALSLAPQNAGNAATMATRFALDQLGLPYVWGGNGPDGGAAGFDCSGLTKASYDSAGLSLPRTADSQFRALPPVPGGQEPALGDLVFYGSPATRIHHVGLYLGNGLMINAPTEGQAIQIHTYHRKGDDYAGAARP
ncbi:C40 family peptidase [Amycolatopsis nigrescens]|uniref:C40 family peptidase n=1 Tax=Amycolatopsis nigrescens TaxID=381445 RepID=UPI000374E900|nr:C40 family peptidase [Amycolatopsis nigrescens]